MQPVVEGLEEVALGDAKNPLAEDLRRDAVGELEDPVRVS